MLRQVAVLLSLGTGAALAAVDDVPFFHRTRLAVAAHFALMTPAQEKAVWRAAARRRQASEQIFLWSCHADVPPSELSLFETYRVARADSILWYEAQASLSAEQWYRFWRANHFTEPGDLEWALEEWKTNAPFAPKPTAYCLFHRDGFSAFVGSGAVRFLAVLLHEAEHSRRPLEEWLAIHDEAERVERWQWRHRPPPPESPPRETFSALYDKYSPLWERERCWLPAGITNGLVFALLSPEQEKRVVSLCRRARPAVVPSACLLRPPRLAIEDSSRFAGYGVRMAVRRLLRDEQRHALGRYFHPTAGDRAWLAKEELRLEREQRREAEREERDRRRNRMPGSCRTADRRAAREAERIFAFRDALALDDGQKSAIGRIAAVAWREKEASDRAQDFLVAVLEQADRENAPDYHWLETLREALAVAEELERRQAALAGEVWTMLSPRQREAVKPWNASDLVTMAGLPARAASSFTVDWYPSGSW